MNLHRTHPKLRFLPLKSQAFSFEVVIIFVLDLLVRH